MFRLYYAVKVKGASSWLGTQPCCLCQCISLCYCIGMCYCCILCLYIASLCYCVSRSGKSKKQMRNEAVEIIGRDTQHSSYLLSNRGHLLTKRSSLVPTFKFWFHFSASATWNGPIGGGFGSPSGADVMSPYSPSSVDQVSPCKIGSMKACSSCVFSPQVFYRM